ncbi:cytosolic phospholipase A2 zeta [Engraulis encrasicolus]|uniref:cytosolic phospholipase A2 zeta n=1 Tax=Engraulis encrasicolus TaxID=184585 RepID=UPI002FD129E2
MLISSHPEDIMSKCITHVEVVPYWKLAVTVLRAELNHSYDYLSASDCYVILKLPTSSARSHRTKTVSNSSRPEWSETFHFRIQSHIKNVLELQVYDEDPFNPDDLCSVILFDVSNLKLAEKQTQMFVLNHTTKDKLWVEFEMVASAEEPGRYLSNGVLMAAPLSILDVTTNSMGRAIQTLILMLRGAYREEHVLTSDLKNPLRYFINKDLETELKLQGVEEVQQLNLSYLDSAKHDVKMSVGQDVVDLELKSEEGSKGELLLRLDFAIPSEEKSFLEKRKEVVGKALQKLLGLSTPPDREKVPLVGVVCSGGGTRAMTGTYGSLKGLQTLGILDAVSYITGVSGSTWAMATLYQDSDWSHKDIGLVSEPMKREMPGRYQDILSSELLSYYMKEMGEKEERGFLVSYIDMWGLAIEHLIWGQKCDATLSDQKMALSEGQNPLPIYTAVNMKTRDDITEAEWCEFTPFEVGFPKYGAFVPTEAFGSEYFLGYLMKSLPEMRLAFLIGIWSSVFSINLTDVWSTLTGSLPSWIGGDTVRTETDNHPSTLDTLMIKPATDMVESITSFFTARPIITQMYNFMRGLALHWNYNTNNGFTIGQEGHPDAFPNQMTPADPTLNLVDAGFYCNIGMPPVLQDHRCMDLILSLDYTWTSNPQEFGELRKAQQYCKDHRLPFPEIDFRALEKEPLKEVYVFEDEKNPKAPIVVHFPMVNDTFREFKAPGVKRGEDEMTLGDVDFDKYFTTNLTYEPKDFQKLMDLSEYNVLNNRDTLLSALGRAMHRMQR